MPLDPEARAVLDALPAGGEIDFEQLDPTLLRLGFDAMSGNQPRAEVAHVEDLRLPGPDGPVPVRVYRPDTRRALPALVYFHGGGFVIGSLDSHDPVCRLLANASGCAVVSVDYRLAPEFPFPAAVEDCYAVTRYVAKHGDEFGVDGSRLAVGGDSAGGNLAAVVALLARENGDPALRHQLLIYPIVANDFDTASYHENADGYLLSRGMMIWFWKQYLEDPNDARLFTAQPLRAHDLSGLAPAWVVTAGFDPLRDEGIAYATRLAEAGVPTAHEHHAGMIHGFLTHFDTIKTGRDAIESAARVLRNSLGD